MSYTLKTLVEELQALAEELGPQTEVRIASQPRWPFDWTISNLSCLHPRGEEIDELRELMASTPSEEWPEDAETRLQELEATPRVVWICEGRQIGYTSDRHWD